MRYIAAAAVICFAAPALAMDHTARLDEVQVSANGSTATQFLELRDISPLDTFPTGPYHVDIYAANGTFLGMVTVPVLPTTGDPIVVIGSAAIAGRVANLPVTLPADGQAC